MTRALLAISGSAPFAGLSQLVSAFWHDLTRDAARDYRPELHYMRGPGPAWRAKNGVHPAA